MRGRHPSHQGRGTSCACCRAVPVRHTLPLPLLQDNDGASRRFLAKRSSSCQIYMDTQYKLPLHHTIHDAATSTLPYNWNQREGTRLGILQHRLLSNRLPHGDSPTGYQFHDFLPFIERHRLDHQQAITTLDGRRLSTRQGRGNTQHFHVA